MAGPSVIASWMNGVTEASAANVRSRFTNSWACVSAAGATIRAASASSAIARARSVSALDRFWATGTTSRSSGASAPIAWLRPAPRPANASPKPRRLAWIAARVGSSNMLRKSSNSTGAGVALASGIVSPSSKPSSDVPRVSSTYLRPSAERGRTSTVVSRGSGSAVRSSFRPSTAMLVPSGRRSASIESTEPTRVPPIRTSLPRTRLAALGVSALSV